jgi:tetratricopeptide (TPR) repeat protein
MEHKNIEDYEIAIRYYSSVLEICPTFIEAYYRRGRAYEKFGQLQKAGIDFALAIKLCPTYIEAHLRLGQIRLQLINLNTDRYQNYYFAALESFNEVLKMEKDNVLAYLGKGKAFQALAEYFEKLANKSDIPADEAENSRKEALDYFDNAITNCNTALQLLKSDKIRYDRAKELNNYKDPEFEICLYLGLSYSSRKKWDKTFQYLSDASNSEDSFIKKSAQNKLNSLKEMGVI